MTQHLIVDVGTSSLRVSMLREDATPIYEIQHPFLPVSPAPGMVEFDAAALGATVMRMCRDALETCGAADAIGITNQRGSTVVWDRETGEPVGPAQGWQDLRTIGDCLALQAEGLRLAPNMPATKVKNLLDTYDPGRTRALAYGTVESWVAFVLSDGSLHVSDPSNAGVSGFWDEHGWNAEALEVLNIPREMMPTIVESTGVCGEARALPGAPPIGALIGDQQASLIGQGCVERGSAKMTFGTGGMLDVCLGRQAPLFEARGEHGTFRIASWKDERGLAWGIEAIMLSAGTCIEWLRDDMGLITNAADSGALAASVPDSGGVTFVPALLGLGTPHWDYGARGTLTGLTRGTTSAHIVRAVLEGIAHRAADMRDAAEADAQLPITSLRVDGGMTDNETFTQLLANIVGVPIDVSPVREATTRGASLLAGVAIGTLGSVESTADLYQAAHRVEPDASAHGRATRAEGAQRWSEARARAEAWIPGLSAINF